MWWLQEPSNHSNISRLYRLQRLLSRLQNRRSLCQPLTGLRLIRLDLIHNHLCLVLNLLHLGLNNLSCLLLLSHFLKDLIGAVIGQHQFLLLHVQLLLERRDRTRRLHQLLQARVHAIGQRVYVVVLLLVDGLVAADERQIRLGCNVSGPPELGEVASARVAHIVVQIAHGGDQVGLCVRRANDFVAGEEVVGDRDERLFGPALEPVDRAAADEAWELERSVAELLADGREAEDNVKVLADALKEVVVEDLLGGYALGVLFFHGCYEQVADLFDLVAREQAADHAAGQDVVDVLEETLFFDVLVGENE
jgi:hypothetical protein